MSSPLGNKTAKNALFDNTLYGELKLSEKLSLEILAIRKDKEL